MLKTIESEEYTVEELFSALEKDEVEVTEQNIQKAKENDAETLYKIGDIYFKKEKYEKAFAWFHKAALQDHADSLAQVGWMYQKELGVSHDFKQAMDWSMKAASKGNANGQYNIGQLYHYGAGVSIDYKQAMDWYLKAVNNGHTLALNEIGWMYNCGEGVTKDIPTAIEWYTKAVNQGHKYAQFNLGFIYQYQDGFKDLQKAINWYQKAADNGDYYAKKYAKELNEQGYYAKDDQKDKGVDQVVDMNSRIEHNSEKVVHPKVVGSASNSGDSDEN